MAFLSSEPSLASISLGARGKNKWRGQQECLGNTPQPSRYHTIWPPSPLCPPLPSNPAPHAPSTQAAGSPCTSLNTLVRTILPLSCILFFLPGTFFPRNCISPLLQLCSNITFPVKPFLFILKLLPLSPNIYYFPSQLFFPHSTYQLPKYYTIHLFDVDTVQLAH